METIKDKAQDLTEDIGQYAEAYYHWKMVQLTDKISGAASVSFSSMMIGVMLFFVLLFLGIGIGWWIGEKLQNMVAGFCITAGIYALLALMVIACRKSIIHPVVRNFVIRKAYE